MPWLAKADYKKFVELHKDSIATIIHGDRTDKDYNLVTDILEKVQPVQNLLGYFTYQVPTKVSKDLPLELFQHHYLKDVLITGLQLTLEEWLDGKIEQNKYKAYRNADNNRDFLPQSNKIGPILDALQARSRRVEYPEGDKNRFSMQHWWLHRHEYYDNNTSFFISTEQSPLLNASNWLPKHIATCQRWDDSVETRKQYFGRVPNNLADPFVLVAWIGTKDKMLVRVMLRILKDPTKLNKCVLHINYIYGAKHLNDQLLDHIETFIQEVNMFTRIASSTCLTGRTGEDYTRIETPFVLDSAVRTDHNMCMGIPYIDGGSFFKNGLIEWSVHLGTKTYDCGPIGLCKFHGQTLYDKLDDSPEIVEHVSTTLPAAEARTHNVVNESKER